jgi:hypothetical protein
MREIEFALVATIASVGRRRDRLPVLVSREANMRRTTTAAILVLGTTLITGLATSAFAETASVTCKGADEKDVTYTVIGDNCTSTGGTGVKTATCGSDSSGHGGIGNL